MPEEAGHPERRILATGVPIDCVNAADPGSPASRRAAGARSVPNGGLPGPTALTQSMGTPVARIRCSW